MKNNIYLLRAILSGVWLIDKRSAEAYFPIINQMLKGEKVDLGTTPQRPYMIVESMSDDEDDYGIQQMPESGMGAVDEDSIAVIPLQGPIIKYDTWCETGAQSIAKTLLEADANSNIRGMIILADTPGGEAFAVETITDAIKQCKKQVVMLVDGMLCSAGMWIGSACDEIIVKGSTSLLGSIGTMITITDFREHFKKEGIELREIYADDSTDKNKEWRDALEKNDQTMKERLLNPLNELFKNAVMSGLPNVNKEMTLTGRTFLADEAISLGLADKRGDIKTAINSIMFGTKYKKLAQFSGKKLGASEMSQLQLVLTDLGIDAKIAVPKSMLFQTQGDKSIFVYAEEGEDPVGKQCVYADAEGNPTSENVEAGEHPLSDGKVMNVSVKDDGLSYVDSIADAQGESEDGGEGEGSGATPPSQSIEQINQLLETFSTDLLKKVDAKLNDLSSRIQSTGRVPGGISGGMNGKTSGGSSKLQQKMDEIKAKNKR